MQGSVCVAVWKHRCNHERLQIEGHVSYLYGLRLPNCNTWTWPAVRRWWCYGWTPASLHQSAFDTQEPAWSSWGRRDVPDAHGAQHLPGAAEAGASVATASKQPHKHTTTQKHKHTNTRSTLALSPTDTFAQSAVNRLVVLLFYPAVVYFIIVTS